MCLLTKHRREGANLTCTFQGHKWKSNSWSGKNYNYWETEEYKNGGEVARHKDEVRQFVCERKCGSQRYEYTNWDHELTREEKVRERLGQQAYTRAMIWLLDGEDEDE